MMKKQRTDDLYQLYFNKTWITNNLALVKYRMNFINEKFRK